MKRSWILLLVQWIIILIALSNTAFATDEVTKLYGGIDLGAWQGHFHQRAFGRQTVIRTDTTWGLQGRVRLQIGILFGEYAPFYYFPYFDERETSDGQLDDARYYSLLSANLGVEVPLIHLEVYVGMSRSHFDFQFGNQTAFSGDEFKIGAALPLVHPNDSVSLKLVGEFHRQFVDRDSVGTLPAQIKTYSNVYFLGLGVMFGG